MRVVSARIAPDAMVTALSSASEYRAKLSVGDVRVDAQKPAEASSTESHANTREDNSPVLPPLPEQPQPPGAAFAVALISGQLPPRPRTEAELQMRLGSADLPTQGTHAVHDRLA